MEIGGKYYNLQSSDDAERRMPDLRAAKKIRQPKFTSAAVIAEPLICLRGC